MLCLCVNVYCTRTTAKLVSTQLQLTNISKSKAVPDRVLKVYVTVYVKFCLSLIWTLDGVESSASRAVRFTLSVH
jgi:hypothetical protein